MNRCFEKVILTSFLLLLGTNVFAGTLSWDLKLTIGDNTSSEHEQFNTVTSFAVSGDYIYLLDSGNGRIQKFDFNGSYVKTIGSPGESDAQFYEPSSITFVNDKLWVADTKNKRIQIFQNDKFLSSFSPKVPAVPVRMASIGNRVFLSHFSHHPTRGGLAIYNEAAQFIGTEDVAIKLFKAPNDIVWNMADLVPLSEDRLLIGHFFINTLVILDKNGNIVDQKDMSSFYEQYEVVQDGEMVMPDGYAASAFGAGPKGTILAAVCDNQKRVCGRIMQFSADLSRLEGEVDFGKQITKISYLEDRGLVVVIFKTDEVHFYDVK